MFICTKAVKQMWAQLHRRCKFRWDVGDKSEAKALMTKADVPVVPGYHGSDQSTSRYCQTEFMDASHILGPVLVGWMC